MLLQRLLDDLLPVLKVDRWLVLGVEAEPIQAMRLEDLQNPGFGPRAGSVTPRADKVVAWRL
jgi:hypothetical protein